MPPGHSFEQSALPPFLPDKLECACDRHHKIRFANMSCWLIFRPLFAASTVSPGLVRYRIFVCLLVPLHTLLNLMSDANKFTERGTIAIDARQEDGGIRRGTGGRRRGPSDANVHKNATECQGLPYPFC